MFMALMRATLNAFFKEKGALGAEFWEHPAPESEQIGMNGLRGRGNNSPDDPRRSPSGSLCLHQESGGSIQNQPVFACMLQFGYR
jgi:hypothetical protein